MRSLALALAPWDHGSTICTFLLEDWRDLAAYASVHGDIPISICV